MKTVMFATSQTIL